MNSTELNYNDILQIMPNKPNDANVLLTMNLILNIRFSSSFAFIAFYINAHNH